MPACQGFLDTVMVQQAQAVAGILTDNQVNCPQDLEGAQGNIPQIADWCSNYIQGSHNYSVDGTGACGYYAAIMIWFIGIIGLVIVAVLLGSLIGQLFRSGSRRRPSHTRPAGSPSGARSSAVPGASRCPVCSAPLGGGRRIYSAVFPGNSDRMMHIFGCPDCYPKEQPLAHPRERRCPVCRKTLTLEDFLIARMFPARPGKPKPHVHVLGCTRCRRLAK